MRQIKQASTSPNAPQGLMCLFDLLLLREENRRNTGTSYNLTYSPSEAQGATGGGLRTQR